MSARICWVLLLISCLAGKGFAQLPDYQFVRYAAEKGLSHNEVHSFLKDRRGFLWIATSGGLNRFDGYTFKVFKYDSRDSTTISDNYITDLFEDDNGYIWIKNRKGYNVFDPETEQITKDITSIAQKAGLPDADYDKIVKGESGNYWILHNKLGLLKYSPKQKKAIPINYGVAQGEAVDCKEDATGALWIVHKDGLLIKLDTKNRVVKKEVTLSRMSYPKSNNYRLFIDNDNEPWVYLIKDVRGIYYFNTTTGKVITCNTTSTDYKLNNNIISSVIQGPDGLLWVGTDHGGINLIDKKNKKVSYLKHNPNDPRSISQNSITTLYKDATGMVWAGTFKSGFCNYHKNVFKFSLYQHQPSVPKSLPFDDVNVFTEDGKGNIWIGTNGGGLVYFDRANNSFRQYKNIPGDKTSISNNIIVSLFVDREQILWAGTYFGGLNRFDGKSFKRYQNNPADTTSLSDDRVWELLEDQKRNLWVGTLGNGLDRLDRKTGRFYHYPPLRPNSVSSEYISAMHEDSRGNLWIGTSGGLDVLESASGKFVHYGRTAPVGTTLSNDAITSICEDKYGNIWVGTNDGLNLFDRKNKSFQVFDNHNGFPDNLVLTSLVDNAQNLWLGTPKGLVNFKITSRKNGVPVTTETKVYNELDGLQGRSFNENASLKLRSGELVFGGAKGFTIFSPEKIAEADMEVPIVLTDFQIFTESVKPGEEVNGKVVLPKSISVIEEVTLKHSQNVFTIEFAALNFLHPDKNHYLYTLEGFTKQWFEADNAGRKVTFTNLDPGEYRFKVKTAGADTGKYGPERTLKITILPPFWRSGWAYFLYFLIIAGALIIARWILLERERMKFRLERERREAQQLHELDLMKIKFFTNVSHEFRTPLTLILTPLESILGGGNVDGGVKKQLQLIQRNTKRLLNLVTQLLDFKKLEVEETEFLPARGDIVQFIKEIAHTFSDLSEKKHIQFSFESSLNSRYTSFDQEKLSRIMYNLLSNAFKFTPAYGHVSVEVDCRSDGSKDVLEVKVRDSGIGIPPESQKRVFERFFQHDLPDTIVNQGSGIGLAITKEFVALHGGSIWVESVVGSGSTFIFTLPLQEEASVPQLEEAEEEPVTDIEVSEEILQEKVDKSLPKLLLVEDNEDFRSYLYESLKGEYQIAEAGNGKVGMKMTLDWIPDLIVSDVMMPEMDGIELCRRVKTDRRISHIPVLLLTARAEEEQQLQGYETGADAYVTKPFRLDILQVRIRNLIKQREQFQKQFQQHIEIRPSEIPVLSMDEQFINKAVKLVEDNIGNSSFSVEELSSEMAMSRVYLYKKVLALTGKTPIEFIRIIRLRRAAQLLEKSQLTVAEIAYQVGFNNPKYFARYFKEEYKMLPTDYMKEKVRKVE